jgi:hypothetical protein
VDESGREAHLSGQVASVVQQLTIERVDVIAEKPPA